jgi:hypothetical protein
MPPHSTDPLAATIPHVSKVKITVVNNENLPYRDAFARPLGVELSSRLLAGLEIARGDVDLCPVLHEAVGHHLADAAAAARDNDDLVLHVEEVAEVEGAHAGLERGACCRVLPVRELSDILLRIQFCNIWCTKHHAFKQQVLVAFSTAAPVHTILHVL